MIAAARALIALCKARALKLAMAESCTGGLLAATLLLLATGMGVGYFVTSRNTWYVDHADGTAEVVATMLFRVLKFVPRSREAALGLVYDLGYRFLHPQAIGQDRMIPAKAMESRHALAARAIILALKATAA